MRYKLIPDDPFKTLPHSTALPVRGTSMHPSIVARATGRTEKELLDLKVGEELRNSRDDTTIRRID